MRRLCTMLAFAVLVGVSFAQETEVKLNPTTAGKINKNLVAELVKALKEAEKESQKSQLAKAVSDTAEDATNSKLLRDAGVIPLLVKQLTWDNGLSAITGEPAPKSIHNAALALNTLANLASNKDAIREAGGIKPLVDLMERKSTDGKPLAEFSAIMAIVNLCIDNEENVQAVRDAGGRPPDWSGEAQPNRDLQINDKVPGFYAKGNKDEL